MIESAVLLNTLRSAVGEDVQIRSATPVGGGCIHGAQRLDTTAGPFFLKHNDAACADLFEAERAGLEALQAENAVRVPRPVCVGSDATQAWLVLEWIDLQPLSRVSAERLGEQLAALHSVQQPAFGFPRDNYIGSTPQPNTPCNDWPEFFRDRRLGFQLGLVRRSGLLENQALRQADRVLERIGTFFPEAPAPALLHGDLWGGNAAATTGDAPVVFDPAAYCGDRETDLAMTELFGGFPPAFSAAYRAVAPLAPGYEQRRTLYQLYHILNHVNLFGRSYAGQAAQMIRSLAEAV